MGPKKEVDAVGVPEAIILCYFFTYHNSWTMQYQYCLLFRTTFYTIGHRYVSRRHLRACPSTYKFRERKADVLIHFKSIKGSEGVKTGTTGFDLRPDTARPIISRK